MVSNRWIKRAITQTKKAIIRAENGQEVYTSRHDCIVCQASDKLRQRYEGYQCSSDVLTACHPKVQKRCKTIIDHQSDLSIELESARYTVLQQLTCDYDMNRIELTKLFNNWIKERNQNHE